MANDRLGLLERYLATEISDGVVRFVLERSVEVDRLLYFWAVGGQDAAGDLECELALVGRAPRGESAGAVGARAVHPLPALASRLGAYLGVLWKNRQLTAGGHDDTVPVSPGDSKPAVELQLSRLQALVACWTAGSAEHDPAGHDPELHLRSEGTLLGNDVTSHERVKAAAVFQERLSEELRRAERHDSPLAVALIQVLDQHDGKTLDRVGSVLGDTLRLYDVLCRGDDGTFMLILPGATDHASGAVVVRLRRQLAHGGIRAVVGIACFPDDGVVTTALLARAQQMLVQDRQRQLEGLVQMDRVPASMVEQLEGVEHVPTIYFQGLERRMPVQVLQTAEGVRLKLHLSFLARGRTFRLDGERSQAHEGVVREVLLSKYRAADDSPVVYLDVIAD